MTSQQYQLAFDLIALTHVAGVDESHVGFSQWKGQLAGRFLSHGLFHFGPRGLGHADVLCKQIAPAKAQYGFTAAKTVLLTSFLNRSSQLCCSLSQIGRHV